MRHREASSTSGRKKINSGDMEVYVIEEGAASVWESRREIIGDNREKAEVSPKQAVTDNVAFVLFFTVSRIISGSDILGVGWDI